MKKYILTLVLSLSALISNAMSYEDARQEAFYLTDKMAYELNLTPQQYDDAYEINLDYLLSLNSSNDIYGNYLTYRNYDLQCILYDWQWSLFAAADYFYHPVCWRYGHWFFPIYNYYHRTCFYYSHPTCYWDYRGGHCRDHYRDGYYGNRRPGNWNGGMRDRERGGVATRGQMVDRGGSRGNHNGDNGYRGQGYEIGLTRGNRGQYEAGSRGGNDNHGNVSRGDVNTTPSQGRGNRNGYTDNRSSGSSTYTPSRGGNNNSTYTPSRGGNSYNGSTPSMGGSRGSRGGSYGGSSTPSMGGSSRGGSMGGGSMGSSSRGGGSSFGGSSRGGSVGGGSMGGSRGGSMGGSTRGGRR